MRRTHMLGRDALRNRSFKRVKNRIPPISAMHMQKACFAGKHAGDADF